jgi:hypothetical protein
MGGRKKDDRGEAAQMGYVRRHYPNNRHKRLSSFDAHVGSPDVSRASACDRELRFFMWLLIAERQVFDELAHLPRQSSTLAHFGTSPAFCRRVRPNVGPLPSPFQGTDHDKTTTHHNAVSRRRLAGFNVASPLR